MRIGQQCDEMKERFAAARKFEDKLRAERLADMEFIGGKRKSFWCKILRMITRRRETFQWSD